MVRLDISLVTEQSFRLHFTYTLTSTKIFIASTVGFDASCYWHNHGFSFTISH